MASKRLNKAAQRKETHEPFRDLNGKTMVSSSLPPITPKDYPIPRDTTIASYCKPHPPSSLKTFLEVAAFIVACYAVFVYTLQWIEARDVGEAQRSTDRPFVGPSNLEHRELFGGDHIIWQTIANYGASPARDVTVQWTWEYELPSTLKDVNWKRQYRGIPALPRGTGNSDQLFLSFEDRKRLTSAGKFYVLGRITYGDYFPQNHGTVHVQHYCRELTRMNGSIEHFAWNWMIDCRGTGFDCSDDTGDCKSDFNELNHKRQK